MKKKLLTGIALTLGIVAAFAFTTIENEDKESLKVGAKAPLADYTMIDVSGEDYDLKSIVKDNGLLVVFSCNTCPFVVGSERMGEGWQTRYNDLKAECDAHGIGMVLVNSNEAKRSGGKTDDTMEAMKAHAKENGYKSLYVLDKNHKLADAFGARTTPHVFLFDGDLKLVYKGAIDDNNESADKAKEHWLKDAINALAEGESIDPAETRNVGCSIKRVKS